VILIKLMSCLLTIITVCAMLNQSNLRRTLKVNRTLNVVVISEKTQVHSSRVRITEGWNKEVAACVSLARIFNCSCLCGNVVDHGRDRPIAHIVNGYGHTPLSELCCTTFCRPTTFSLSGVWPSGPTWSYGCWHLSGVKCPQRFWIGFWTASFQLAELPFVRCRSFTFPKGS
jgi:hypothetical protein